MKRYIMMDDQFISYPRLEEGYIDLALSVRRTVIYFLLLNSDSGPIPRILISNPTVNRLAISFEHYLSILEMNIRFVINGVYLVYQ